MRWIFWPLEATIWLAEIFSRLLKKVLPPGAHPLIDYLVAPFYLVAVMLPIVLIAYLGQVLWTVTVVAPAFALKWLLSTLGMGGIASGAALLALVILTLVFMWPAAGGKQLEGRPPEMDDSGE